jgi:hypothetical protein
MAYSGIGVSFLINDGVQVPPAMTDRSTDLDGVTPSSEPDDLDGTTFQPGVAAPAKVKVPGFRERGLSLSGKWTESVETFWSALEGKVNLPYEYAPIGTTSGKPKITGTCNCLSYSGAVSTVDGVITFTVELAVNTRTTGVFTVEELAGRAA